MLSDAGSMHGVRNACPLLPCQATLDLGVHWAVVDRPKVDELLHDILRVHIFDCALCPISL